MYSKTLSFSPPLSSSAWMNRYYTRQPWTHPQKTPIQTHTHTHNHTQKSNRHLAAAAFISPLSLSLFLSHDMCNIYSN